MSEQPWVEKYKPQKIKDIVGNKAAISKITDWLQQWPKSGSRLRRALMIVGPTGTGKTIAIHTIASELGFEVSEINASVKRSKKMMDELLKTSTMTGTLTASRGRIVLIDELAGLSGKSDRGAASAIAEHIQKTLVPLILITNDVTEPKIRPLLKITTMIEFATPEIPEIINALKRICVQEKIKCEEAALEILAISSRGDIRAAINDLQTIAKTGTVINKKVVSALIKSRDQTTDISETLDGIFYAETWNKAVSASNQTDVYPDELIRWISNNVTSIYPDLEQQLKAFELLSRASIFSRRISRTQNWRLLPYSKQLMCITGSITDGKPTPKRSEYRYPEWIRQMGFSRNVRQKRELLGQILSPIVHLSAKKSYEEYVTVLKALLRNSSTKKAVATQLNLPEELVQFILKDSN